MAVPSPPPVVSPRRLLLVAVGGAVGTALRYLVTSSEVDGGFPWPTLLVNLVGAALLGWLLGALGRAPLPGVTALLGVGLLGAFTTFASLMVTTLTLERSTAGLGFLYLTCSLVGGPVAAAGGLWWGRRC